MRTLMYCAVNQGRTVRKHEIAEACNASENHLAQVIHLLGQRGFIRTVRGRHGGLALGRPAEEIRVGEVFRSFEKCVPFAECFSGKENHCPLFGDCRLTGVLADALDAFYSTLDAVRISDLVDGNTGLEGLLKAA